MSLQPDIRDDGQVTVSADEVTDAPQWAASHRGYIYSLLLRHGAVLVTGLPIRSGADLVGIRDALGLRPAQLREQFAARRDLGDGVYTMPEWAADREQCLHHEQGYNIEVPRTLLVACLTPADVGGAMLLGDTRAALLTLPAHLVERFRTEGWLLERNFRPRFGLPWTMAFGTESPDEVERYCDERLIAWEWRRDGALHATQRRAAIVTHPVTGEECWFNDVAFFSQWSVDTAERNILLSAFGADGLPFNTYFGGGDLLDPDSWRRILDGYDAVLRRIPWRTGDLLLLDNILTAHGREPYVGTWEIAVAPAAPVRLGLMR